MTARSFVVCVLSLVIVALVGCDSNDAPSTPLVVSSALSAEILPGDADVSHRFPVQVRLTNEGQSEVVVFRPLDGSNYGWHLPYYRFEVTSMSGEVLKPLSRCGVSGLWADTTWPASYAVKLAPGESFDVKLDPPHIAEPGTYRVRFAYEYRVDTKVQLTLPTPPNAWVGVAESPEIVVIFPAEPPGG